MEELLAKIKSNKLIKKIIVDVNIEQDTALQLYKNAGFQKIKHYKTVLGDSKEHDLYQLQMLIN